MTPATRIVGQPGRWNVKGPSSLSVRVGAQMRYRMFDMFMLEFHPTEASTILDVGVTDEGENVSESCNYFEDRYPNKHLVSSFDSGEINRCRETRA